MIFEKKILDIYRGMAFTRCDDSGNVFYFSADNFSGLKSEPYVFTASAGHQLQGYIYIYENPIPDRLVVFDHGFGGGHRSYMKEIELLCRRGYTVFAYDHTGCMESGGKDTNGMAQSLCDLNDCISTIKADSRFAGCSISVVGHSWGGFSTLNITALHPKITHIVALAGFVSVELLVNSYFGGVLKPYRKAIMALERQANPSFVGYNAIQTLASSPVKALLIYSDNDMRCHKAVHYDALEKALDGKENIRLMLVSGKGHNPNYTGDAVKYMDEFFTELTRKTKKKQLQTAEQKAAFRASFDWERMTAQDEAVWEEIFDFLEG